MELCFGENEGLYIGVWPALLGELGPATFDYFVGLIARYYGNNILQLL